MATRPSITTAATSQPAVTPTQQSRSIMTANSSQGAAIQTASLNDQTIMTYMPEQQQNAAEDDWSDYLMEDETQFKASLDALLDINDEPVNNTQQSQVALQQVPATTDYCSGGAGGGRTAIQASSVLHQPPQQPQRPPPAVLPGSASALTQRLAGIMVPQQQGVAMTAAAPTYVSGSSSSSSVQTTPRYASMPSTAASLPQKRPHVTTSSYNPSNPAVSENEEDQRKRKRNDRNVREQQRSHRITQQISHLRSVLENANVQFKPDKYSTLVSVGEYIKQLQQRSALLDSEHKTLLDTIKKTGQMVMNTHVIPASGASSESTLNTNVQPSIPTTSSGSGEMCIAPMDSPEDELFCFVQGLDYQRVFTDCGMALAVASIDGRFMDANVEFERLSGFTRAELLPNCTSISTTLVGSSDSANGTETMQRVWPPRNLSLFNLFSRQDMEQLFMAMSDMLKRPFSKEDVKKQFEDDYWSGSVRQSRKSGENDQELQMNITLVRSPHGRPKYFCCALTPKYHHEEEEGTGSSMSSLPMPPQARICSS